MSTPDKQLKPDAQSESGKEPEPGTQPEIVAEEEIRQAVDAVSGATWGSRDNTMDDSLFRGPDESGPLPKFRPPGEAS